MKLKMWHWGLVGSAAMVMAGCASSQPMEEQSRAELIEDINIIEPIEVAEAPAPAVVAAPEPTIIEKKVYIEKPVEVPVIEERIVEKETVKQVNVCTAADLAAMRQQQEYFIKAGNKKARAARVRTSGYGAPPKKFYPEAQRRLLAMRAAKVDAYRALAERIKGLHIWGGTTVGDMVVEHDRFQVFVDATLQGARVISNHEMEDGSFETVLEVNVGQSFLSDVLPEPAMPKISDACLKGKVAAPVVTQHVVEPMAAAEPQEVEVVASVTLPVQEEPMPAVSSDMQMKSPGFYYSE